MSKKVKNITPCISAEQMQMISMGSLSSLEMKQIYDHTAGCSFCEEVIDVLSPESISDILSVTGKVNARVAAMVGPAPKTPFFRDSNLRWIVVTSLVAVVGFFALYSLFSGTTGTGNMLMPGESRIVLSLSSGGENQSGETMNIQIGEKQQGSTETLNPENEKILNEKKTEQQTGSTAAQIQNQSQGKNQSTTLSPGNTGSAKRVTVSRIELEVIGKNSLPEGGSSGTRKNGQLTGGKNKGGGYKLEDMPEFRGGDEYLKTYLHDQIWKQVPDRDNLLGVTLTVFFDVTSKGKVENPEVIGKLTEEQRHKVIEVINGLPRFNPGKGKGSVTYTLAVSFD